MRGSVSSGVDLTPFFFSRARSQDYAGDSQLPEIIASASPPAPPAISLATNSLQDAGGRTELAGAARLLPTGDRLLDKFLQLPADALLVLEVQTVVSRVWDRNTFRYQHLRALIRRSNQLCEALLQRKRLFHSRMAASEYLVLKQPCWKYKK